MTYNQKYILKYLKEHSTDIGKIQINDVLLVLYPNIDSKNFERVKYEAQIINKEMSWLDTNKYIKYDGGSLGIGNSSKGYSWVTGENLSTVKAEITKDGINFVESEENKSGEQVLFESTLSTNQSIRDLNFATLENTSFYRRAQYWNITTMILTAIFIAISTWVSCQQLSKLNLPSSFKEQLPKQKLAPLKK